MYSTFLSLAGYYRRFVPNSSSVVSPLSDLTRKREPDSVQWFTEAKRAFQTLEMSLTSSPMWKYPDFTRTFLVHTDAPKTGLDTVLFQESDREENPIIYVSRKLTLTEQRYVAVEQEALAIKWAIEELQYYLTSRQFTLITNHAPCSGWLKPRTPKTEYPTGFFLCRTSHSCSNIEWGSTTEMPMASRGGMHSGPSFPHQQALQLSCGGVDNDIGKLMALVHKFTSTPRQAATVALKEERPDIPSTAVLKGQFCSSTTVDKQCTWQRSGEN